MTSTAVGDTKNIYTKSCMESVAMHSLAFLSHVDKREYELSCIQLDLARASATSFRRLMPTKYGVVDENVIRCDGIIAYLQQLSDAIEHRRQLNRRKASVLEDIIKISPEKKESA